jgi:hypothetical protein
MIIKQIQHENKVSQSSGKTFESCRILTTNPQGQDVWISGFGSPITHTWEIGDSVDVDIEQRDKYFNFRENKNTRPSPDKKLKLLQEIDRKLDLLIGSKSVITDPKGIIYQTKPENASGDQFGALHEAIDTDGNNEIRIEDIPF